MTQSRISLSSTRNFAFKLGLKINPFTTTWASGTTSTLTRTPGLKSRV